MQIGIALILLSVCALIALTTSGTSALLSGWIMVVAGVVEALQAFRLRRTDGFFLHLVPGIAGVPIGLLIATHPAAGAFTWMLLFAAVFTIVGVFRILSAARLKFPSWPWAIFDGAITLLLGTVLWAAWTWLGTWFFAFAVGVSLFVRGWSWLMFARLLQKLAILGLSPARQQDNRPETSPNSQAVGSPSSFSFVCNIHKQP